MNDSGLSQKKRISLLLLTSASKPVCTVLPTCSSTVNLQFKMRQINVASTTTGV